MIFQDNKSNEGTPKNVESPLVFNRDTAPAYWFVDVLWVILVDGEQSGGRYSLMEQWMRKGAGPPLHVHGFSDEHFYVLDGQMEMQVGEKRMTAGAGQSVWIPRRTPHGFKVTSEICHALNSYTPAGFEQAVKGLAKPAERREIPPPMHDGHLIHKLQSNYWVAEAEDAWAATTLHR
jgi:mannose-6-phosphate isomerase-like protein (cupin superfamily)